MFSFVSFELSLMSLVVSGGLSLADVGVDGDYCMVRHVVVYSAV